VTTVEVYEVLLQEVRWLRKEISAQRDETKEQKELLIKHMDKEEKERDEIMEVVHNDKQDYMEGLHTVKTQLEDVKQTVSHLQDKLTWWSATLHTLKLVAGGAIIFLTIKFGDIKNLFK